MIGSYWHAVNFYVLATVVLKWMCLIAPYHNKACLIQCWDVPSINNCVNTFKSPLNAPLNRNRTKSWVCESESNYKISADTLCRLTLDLKKYLEIKYICKVSLMHLWYYYNKHENDDYVCMCTNNMIISVTCI